MFLQVAPLGEELTAAETLVPLPVQFVVHGRQVALQIALPVEALLAEPAQEDGRAAGPVRVHGVLMRGDVRFLREGLPARRARERLHLRVREQMTLEVALVVVAVAAEVARILLRGARRRHDCDGAATKFSALGQRALVALEDVTCEVAREKEFLFCPARAKKEEREHSCVRKRREGHTSGERDVTSGENSLQPEAGVNDHMSSYVTSVKR